MTRATTGNIHWYRPQPPNKSNGLPGRSGGSYVCLFIFKHQGLRYPGSQFENVAGGFQFPRKHNGSVEVTIFLVVSTELNTKSNEERADSKLIYKHVKIHQAWHVELVTKATILRILPFRRSCVSPPCVLWPKHICIPPYPPQIPIYAAAYLIGSSYLFSPHCKKLRLETPNPSHHRPPINFWTIQFSKQKLSRLDSAIDPCFFRSSCVAMYAHEYPLSKNAYRNFRWKNPVYFPLAAPSDPTCP